MPLDPRHVGRRYGPFLYEVGFEKLREFSWALGGSIPSTGFSSVGPPPGLHPLVHDREAGRASPHGDVVALPTFAVVFAMGPFGAACRDPEVGVDLTRLVHGEQEFEFHRPVKPGDLLTTHGEIADIRHKSGLTFLAIRSTTTGPSGEPVVTGLWTAVIRG